MSEYHCPFTDANHNHPMRSQARLARHLEKHHGIERPKVEPFKRIVEICGSSVKRETR